MSVKKKKLKFRKSKEKGKPDLLVSNTASLSQNTLGEEEEMRD
jgi:hypothetical protein